jgi:hypothetical protein
VEFDEVGIFALLDRSNSLAAILATGQRVSNQHLTADSVLQYLLHAKSGNGVMYVIVVKDTTVQTLASDALGISNLTDDMVSTFYTPLLSFGCSFLPVDSNSPASLVSCSSISLLLADNF